MVVDPLASRGVIIERASAATLVRLAAAGIEVKPAALVDLTIAGARYETVKTALDILTTAPEFDLVLAVIGSSARSQPEMTVRPVIDSAGASKPLAAFIVPEAPEALAALSRAGVPTSARPRRAPMRLPRRWRGSHRQVRALGSAGGATGPSSTNSHPARCSTAWALHARPQFRSTSPLIGHRSCLSPTRSR